jgi:dTDP-glucose 4,6-dehydratase
VRILVTGGAGFIGSNFVRYMLHKHPDYKIIVLDKLTYAGRLENLQDTKNKIQFIKGDICHKQAVDKAIRGCQAIFNFAAETHVDRSIIDAGSFVKTDILGTYTLLETARKHGVDKFIQISTDEVYGSVESGSFKETDILEPSSPYSASKAGADLLVKAYHKTYNLPVLITRSSNNFGPFQYPEKLIPVLILNALQNKPLPIYGDGKNIRDWLYVEDNCEGIELVLQEGKAGETYNLASGNERMNLEIAELILKELNKPPSLIQFVKDRPGHDFRYSLDTTKVRDLGWKPGTDFEQGLKRTIKWYQDNKWWWKPLL